MSPRHVHVLGRALALIRVRAHPHHATTVRDLVGLHHVLEDRLELVDRELDADLQRRRVVGELLEPPLRESSHRAKRRTRSPAASPTRTADLTARRAPCRAAWCAHVLRGRERRRRAWSRAWPAFVELVQKPGREALARKRTVAPQGPEPGSGALLHKSTVMAVTYSRVEASAVYRSMRFYFTDSSVSLCLVTADLT